MNRILSCIALMTLLASSFIPQQAWGLDCSPADLTLSNQAEVDGVLSSGCTHVTGYLLIQGSDITNLAGLANLTNIGGNLDIEFNPVLTNLTGLDGITSLSELLYVANNATLTNLAGLEGITSVGGRLYIEFNPALTNLDGLAGLTSVKAGLLIGDNIALTNLDGLAGLTSVSGGFNIYGNSALTNLDGLAGLTSVERFLYIGYNSTLTDLDGLANFTSLSGDFYLEFNTSLAICTGLSALLDDVDDGLEGPGTVESGVPDVAGNVKIEGNAEGCNSIAEAILPYVQVPVPAMDHSGLAILVLLTLFAGFVGFRRRA